MRDAPGSLDFNSAVSLQCAETRGHLPLPEIAARLNARIGDLARELLGEPNRALSTTSQLRYGTKGSIAIEINGPEAGKWYDHEHGVGGDALALICHRHGLANGAACSWARHWLGLPIHTRATTERPSAPEADATGIQPRSKNKKDELAAKVAGIVASCQDITGTAAEAYLRNRGITALPLPPALRFVSNAYGRYGALVALATDAEGAVHAMQQIYVTENGRKAPLKVQKRTNKVHDGWSERASVRLPGAQPLVLCEGTETALSVWQATSRETWACLGIANIGRAPVPEGAAIVIARDGDAPGSRADRQIAKAHGERP